MLKQLTFGALAIAAGLAAMPAPARADPPWERGREWGHGDRDREWGRGHRDREWEHRGRWEHDRWERRREFERPYYGPGYNAPPPVYYAPRPYYPPPVYTVPGTNLYLPFR